MPEPIDSARRFRFLRWSWLIYAAGLAAIVAYAARLRFSLPQAPIIDPDYWGYLNPALSKLAGGPFEHTSGRNIIYPAFLYVVLRVAGDFRGICLAQHVLGLATGILLAIAWNLLCAALAISTSARAWARLVGLALAAEFLCTTSPLLFEHTVRPEAVFPFFLALSFVCNLGALRAGYLVPRPRLEAWCLAVNFFVIAVAQALKPSLGFGAVAANLPLAVFLLRRGPAWRMKVLVLIASIGATAPAIWLPERILAASDSQTATFLPVTLFSVHARVIEQQIADDIRNGQTAPYEKDWLAAFDRQLVEELDAAGQPDQSPYRTLGFNPDYLMYVRWVFKPAFQRKENAAIVQFALHYFARTWRYRPGPMLHNVLIQLGQVYRFFPYHMGRNPVRDFLRPVGSAREFALARPYQDSVKCADHPTQLKVMRANSGGGAYLDALTALGATDAAIHEPAWVNDLNVRLTRWHLPLLLATIAIGAILLGLSWRRYLPSVAGVWLIWATNFLMFVTVAFVHSLEPHRYQENQRVCTVFGEFAALLLAGQMIAWVGARARTRIESFLATGRAPIRPPRLRQPEQPPALRAPLPFRDALRR